MKNWILVFVGGFLLSLSGFNQDNQVDLPNAIIGDWEWVREETISRGSGNWVTPQTCNCSRKLIVKNSSEFTYYEDDKLVISGNYILLVDATSENKKNVSYYFSASDLHGGIYIGNDGLLRFGSIGSCGVVNVYRKVN